MVIPPLWNRPGSETDIHPLPLNKWLTTFTLFIGFDADPVQTTRIIRMRLDWDVVDQASRTNPGRNEQAGTVNEVI
jgi:hypothetical protein